MDTDPPIAARLHNPAELIAALPALLGFYPSESLIVVYVRTDRVTLLARQDLHVLTAPEPVAAMVTPTAYAPADTAHIVIVSTDHGSAAARRAADAVRDRLSAAGISVPHVLFVPAVQAGKPWWCGSHPGCRGQVLDPRSSAVAAAAAYAGQYTYPSRHALAAHLEPHDPETLARRAAAIEALRAAGAPTPRDAAQLIRSAIDAATRGLLPTSEEHITRLAAALTYPWIRDASLAHSVGGNAEAAEALWTALTRATPAPYRAEPAALLAITTYVRGNGALALLALHTAAEAQPGHSLTALFRLTIATGLSPSHVRDLITTVLTGPAAKQDRGRDTA